MPLQVVRNPAVDRTRHPQGGPCGAVIQRAIPSNTLFISSIFVTSDARNSPCGRVGTTPERRDGKVIDVREEADEGHEGQRMDKGRRNKASTIPRRYPCPTLESSEPEAWGKT